MAASLLSGRACLIAVAALMLLAALAHFGRRNVVAAFFVDGEPGPAPKLLQPPPDAPKRDLEAARLRVVLVDGLGADHAEQLPNFDRLCAAGFDLQVDNGFPTVSMPVQHVLWTGLTQPQSGVMYRIAPLSTPPQAGLPRRVPGSVAVAESHTWIVRSFGFAHSWPVLPDGDEDASWRETGFAEQAEAAVAGDDRLVFVHVLRVDEAGHAAGAASSSYAQAATWADDLLARLVQADPRPDTRWVVLSDHGHRPAGGHGGAERPIRVVRACVFGHVPLADKTRGAVHLVDLHTLLAATLGLQVDPRSAGRSITFALDNPQTGATLPRSGLVRWGVALVWLAIGLGLTGWAARGHAVAWPSWAAVAYISVVWLQGHATLSNPMVYPPLGLDMLVAALPGFVVLVACDWAWREEDVALRRRVVAHLALPVAASLGALTLCAGLAAPFGLMRVPPLVPRWTAHASVLLTLVAAAALVVAISVLVRWVASRNAASAGPTKTADPGAPSSG